MAEYSTRKVVENLIIGRIVVPVETEALKSAQSNRTASCREDALLMPKNRFGYPSYPRRRSSEVAGIGLGDEMVRSAAKQLMKLYVAVRPTAAPVPKRLKSRTLAHAEKPESVS